MHRGHTGEMSRTGIEALRSLPPADSPKCFAWPLGYILHVVGDVTVYPVVQLKVGPYEQNKQAHRVCEMHQDAHIFRRLGVGAVGGAEYLAGGIAACSAPGTEDKLDPAAAKSMVQKAEGLLPRAVSQTVSRPARVAQSLCADLGRARRKRTVFCLCPACDVKLGLTYPIEKEIDPQYSKGPATPEGAMDYGAVFDRVLDNVLRA